MFVSPAVPSEGGAVSPQLSQAELEAKAAELATWEAELFRRADVLNGRDEAHRHNYRVLEATKEELCETLVAFMVENLGYTKPTIDAEGLLNDVESALDDIDSAMSAASSAESAAQEAYSALDEIQSQLFSLQSSLQKLED